MRLVSLFFATSFIACAMAGSAYSQNTPTSAKPSKESAPKQVEVTAEDSLEWYQDQSMYVARGKAKAVRGEMVVESDVLTAHQREKTKPPPGSPPIPKNKGTDASSGDIDKMTAEGHVVITDPRERIVGDHAVYDLDQHVAVVTGSHLKYETEKEIVTARDTLEYWEDKKIAVARGNAVGVSGDRHVEGDVLTAEFINGPNGDQQLSKMTAEGHVTIITKGNVSRGNHAVYDETSNIAILTGNVRVTRGDGTELTGDVGEVNFDTNQSRLLNSGKKTRVRALLPTKSSAKPEATVAAGTP